MSEQARKKIAAELAKSQQPSFFDRFTLENAMNIPHNIYANTSNAIGAGIRGIQHHLDPATAPNPRAMRQSVNPRHAQAAFDVAGVVGGAGVGATAAARVAGRPMTPGGAVGMFGMPRKKIDYRIEKSPDANDGDVVQFYAISNKDNRDLGGIEAVYHDSDVVIGNSNVLPKYRGQGIGKDLYKSIIDHVHNSGRHVSSDAAVSPSAQQVYAALARDGYDVRRNPKAIYNPKDKSYYVPYDDELVDSHGHMFRVAKPGTPGTEFFSSGVPGIYINDED